jgi:hypothetical protein
MKKKLMSIVIGMSALISVAAHAQNDACAALLCMSGPGSAAPHECRPYVDSYFDIKVYRHGRFHPVRTAQRRYDTILNQCGDARQEDRDRLHIRFGHLEHNPFHFN